VGFFKDLNKLNKQAKEIQANQPPVKEQMANAMAQMQAANDFLAQQAAAAPMAHDPNAVEGTAQVLAVRDTGMRINLNASLQIDLLITIPGQPPRPATITSVVEPQNLARVQPGTQLRVRANPQTPEQALIIW
jgi:hypothetical protein